jgi:cell division protein FtsQ
MRRLITFRGAAKRPRKGSARRRMTAAWRPWAWRLALLAVLSGVAVGGPVALWRSDAVGTALTVAENGAIAATAALGLRLRQVLVEGRVETSRQQILAALGAELGMPLLRLDPGAAKRRLEGLGWVRSAVVARRLPGTIFVRIEERRPLALWQQHGRFTVIGQDGRPIAGLDARRYRGLMQVVGPGAGARAPRLIAMLDGEPTLKARVAAAVWVSGRRWDLQLDNGVNVRLPAAGVDLAWSRLARLQGEHGILDRAVVAIDLRLPDRLVVRKAARPREADTATPGSAPRRRRAGDET